MDQTDFPLRAGDDRWDIRRGTGVCTDTHFDYLHTGCDSIGGSKVMMSLFGCTGRAFGWTTLFCGAVIEFGEDYVSDVGISAFSLLYPRVLQEEVEFKGEQLLRITCSNPIDCSNKCEAMDRSARKHGLPAPLACALCDPPCPSNPGTSFIDTVHAFVDDVASALQLAAICINPVACTCQIFMMVRKGKSNLLEIRYTPVPRYRPMRLQLQLLFHYRPHSHSCSPMITSSKFCF